MNITGTMNSGINLSQVRQTIKLKEPLSKRLSEAVIQAVNDLKEVTALGVGVDMDYWIKDKGNSCAVCLGGAALVCRNEEPDVVEHTWFCDGEEAEERTISASEAEEYEESVLYAEIRTLNYFRKGWLSSAIDRWPHYDDQFKLYFNTHYIENSLRDFEPIDYTKDFDGFTEQLITQANKLNQFELDYELNFAVNCVKDNHV